MAKDTVHPRGLLVEPHVDRTQSPAPSQQQSTGLTIDALAAALRLTTGEAVEEPNRSKLERQLRAAEAEVDDYAPGANAFSRNEAIIRLVGFLLDSTPTALNNAPQVNALRMSGAMALVSQWHVF